MTDLQVMHAEARGSGANHHAALRELAARTSLDPDTIGRQLERARVKRRGRPKPDPDPKEVGT